MFKKLAEFYYQFNAPSVKFRCKIFKVESEDEKNVLAIDFCKSMGPPMHFISICAQIYISMDKSCRKLMKPRLSE